MPSPAAHALSMFLSILLSLGQSITHNNALYISNYYIIHTQSRRVWRCLWVNLNPPIKEGQTTQWAKDCIQRKSLRWLSTIIVYIVKPVHATTSIKRSHVLKCHDFFYHVIENFICSGPLYRPHRSQTTTFDLSQMWPLNTDLTTILYTVKKSFIILNGSSESVNRRRLDKTMAKRKMTNNVLQNITHKTEDRVTRTQQWCLKGYFYITNQCL